MAELAQQTMGTIERYRLEQACSAGDKAACDMLQRPEPQQEPGMQEPQGGLAAVRPAPQQEEQGIDYRSLLAKLLLPDEQRKYILNTDRYYNNFLDQMAERDRAAALGREIPEYNLGPAPTPYRGR